MGLRDVLLQLSIGIVGGIISGIIVTYIFKPELKKFLSKESLRLIFRKEIALAVVVIIIITVYGVGIKMRWWPYPEIHDYATVHVDGKAYTKDLCHPEKRLIPGPAVFFPYPKEAQDGRKIFGWDNEGNYIYEEDVQKRFEQGAKESKMENSAH